MSKNDELEFMRLIAVADMLGEPSGEIVRRAARSLKELRSDFRALQHALVGPTGLSAIEEAHRLRALHPIT